MEGFKRWMAREGYAVATINCALATLKSYARLAAQAGAIAVEQASLIATVRGYGHKQGRNLDAERPASRRGVKKAQPVALSLAHARALKEQPGDTPQGRRDALLVCLLLDHGLRVGELAALPVGAISLDAGTLVFYLRAAPQLEQRGGRCVGCVGAAERPHTGGRLQRQGHHFRWHLGSRDFQRIADAFVAAVRAAGPVDGVYFALHGAMVAVGEDDPEGYLLEQTRRIVGERVPIVASFDLHGIVTDRILRHCDAITIYHTYPHVDFFQTGDRAARLLLKILDGGARPTTARVPIPALVRGDELITATGLFGRSIRAAQAIEASPGGLSAGMFIGNPFTDVPELCSNAIVVTDNDPARAEREALAFAADFWAVRERLQQPLTPLDEAVRAALAVQGGTLVLVDTADATSSGAPGDSNAIVAALKSAGYGGRVLAPLVDAPAVSMALAAGVGSTVRLAVGGAIDPRHRPLPLVGRVRLLSDGSFRNESDGAFWHGGPTAVVESEGITLVITSRPVSLYDRSLFLAHGQDPQQFDLVVVKSPHCQPRFYADWAARMINVDAPGATSANLRSLGHTRCMHPIAPLDDEVAFVPQARLFSR